VDFIALCKEWKAKLTPFLKVLQEETSDGELAAFASYALAFPDAFVALVDTYDTVR
jgi:nicotinate phosphoribosyltransferase